MNSLLQLLKETGDQFNESFVVADLHREDMPLVYVNQGFQELTGYNESEIVGRNCRFLQGESTDKDTVTAIRHSIKDRSSCYYNLLNHKKDGAIFWNRLIMFPVGHSEGEYDYYVGIQQKVSDSKNVEYEFNNSISKEQIQGKVINPFGKILNSTRTYQYLTLTDTEDHSNRLEEIQKDVQILAKSINQYIDSL